MKKNLILLFIIQFTLSLSAQEKSLFDYKIKDLKGQEINLQSKAVLLVNIATRCGFTNQLDDLEAIYQKYKSKGLLIVGIPSNDFASQTPEKGQKIANFCRLKYGVTFPLSSKSVVINENKEKFIEFAVNSSGGKEIAWNFEKFLFNKKGKFVARFSSSTEPWNKSIINLIEEAL